jgi:hypothetical protein
MGQAAEIRLRQPNFDLWCRRVCNRDAAICDSCPANPMELPAFKCGKAWTVHDPSRSNLSVCFFSELRKQFPEVREDAIGHEAVAGRSHVAVVGKRLFRGSVESVPQV